MDNEVVNISAKPLYPMGAVTFAIACTHCKNINSDKCKCCRQEIESGFEIAERRDEKIMTDNEIKKALDILDRFDLFGGQRAGRELWNEKPVDVQNEDIENFVKDVVFLKDLINRQKAENERLQEDSKRLKKVQMQLDDLCIMHNIIKAEAVKEFAEELLETKFKHGNDYIIYAENVYTILKEKVGEDNA